MSRRNHQLPALARAPGQPVFKYPNSGPLYGEPLYPGHGYPARPGEDRPGLSPFGRLAKGQNLGKSSLLIYNAAKDGGQQSPVDMFQIEGDDLDAQQLTITLHPPRVIPLTYDRVLQILDQQNLTGEQTNAEVTVGSFPGTNQHMAWPPLEAMIEFGVGGVSTTAVVDFMNGVTLTAQASYIRARALVSQSAIDAGLAATSAAYYLAAHVGPGFAESHAQRTIFAGELDNLAESVALDVPKFAKVATLMGSRVGSGSPQLPVGYIRFWQSPNGTNGVADAFVSGASRVEVPNAGQYFSVVNQSGVAMRMSVIFELSL